MKRLFILVFILIGILLFPNLVYAQNLVGYWKFDEGSGSSAADSSDNLNIGTLINMESTDWVDGKFGKALAFDGVNEYISIPDSATLNPTSAITIETWIKLSSKSAWDTVLSKPYTTESSPYQQYSLSLDSTGDKIGFELTTGGLRSEVWSTTSPVTGTWYHFIGVYNGTHMSVYLDGVKENSIVKTGNINNYGMDLSIGRYEPSTVEYFNGIIDEVRIYDYALTDEDVEDRYNQGNVAKLYGTLKDKDNNPVNTNIIAYQQGTSNIINSTNTDSLGNYDLLVSPEVYDIQFNLTDFYIPDYYIKFLSVNLNTDLQNIIYNITGYSSLNKVIFYSNIENPQTIHTYSESMPNVVRQDGAIMENVTSLPNLKNNTWYHSSINKKLYIIPTPWPVPVCRNDINDCEPGEDDSTSPYYCTADCPLRCTDGTIYGQCSSTKPK